MFCKFVVGIRHLYIKIIYTSRTGQMIVLYNHINPINQIKNRIACHAFYLYIPRIYSFILCFSICTFGQCANYPPVLFYPLIGGRFTFLLNSSAAGNHRWDSLTHPTKNSPHRSPTPSLHHPVPKLYKIPTQFQNNVRHRLRHTTKISLNHYNI